MKKMASLPPRKVLLRSGRRKVLLKVLVLLVDVRPSLFGETEPPQSQEPRAERTTKKSNATCSPE